MPERIKLSRAKGWRMPPNTVKVTRPGKWGNPFKAGMFRDFSAADAVEAFRFRIEKDAAGFELRRQIGELRGKNLACWCAIGQPCHADVLLDLANRAATKKEPS